MTTTPNLTDDDRKLLSRWTVGRGRDRRPGTDWLATNPEPHKVLAWLTP